MIATTKGKLATDNTFFSLKLTMSIFDIISNYSIGFYHSITSSGKPHIFSGLLPILLLGAGFAMPTFSWKKKVGWAAIFFVLIYSFLVTGLDRIWHGFQNPIWFPFRYSFLFSFCLIWISWHVFQKMSVVINSSKKNAQSHMIKGIAFSCFVLFYISILTQKIGVDSYSDHHFHFTILFLIGYGFLFSLLFGLRNKSILMLLMILFIFEIGLNYFLLTKGVEQEFFYTNRESFIKFRTEGKELAESIPNEKDQMFRVEKAFRYSRNDAISFGYYGISHYSSAYDKKILQLFKALGILQEHYYTIYDGSNIFLDSFFGIKYIINKRESVTYYPIIVNKGEYIIQKNMSAFPLGIFINNSLLNYSLNEGLGIENQTNIFSLLFPEIEGKLFRKVTSLSLNSSGSNISFSSVGQEVLYLVDGGNVQNMIVHINGVQTRKASFSGNCFEIGKFDANTSNAIRLEFEGITSLGIGNFYALNLDIFQKAVQKINKFNIKIDKKSDQTLVGFIPPNKFEYILLTIPYDEGWSVKVENKKINTVRGLDSLLAFKSPQNGGKLVLEYWPPGLTLGIFLSLISCISSACFIFIRKKNYEQSDVKLTGYPILAK